MPLEVYYYIMMLFELKNANITYQHATSIIFHEHLHKIVECYVDDLAIKSKSKDDHLWDLKMMYNIMKASNKDEFHQVLKVS